MVERTTDAHVSRSISLTCISTACLKLYRQTPNHAIARNMVFLPLQSLIRRTSLNMQVFHPRDARNCQGASKSRLHPCSLLVWPVSAVVIGCFTATISLKSRRGAATYIRRLRSHLEDCRRYWADSNKRVHQIDTGPGLKLLQMILRHR